jgi:hypothetical protein
MCKQRCRQDPLRLVGLLLVGLTACSLGPQKVEAVTLSLSFKPGDRYAYKIHTGMELTQSHNGRTQPLSGEIDEVEEVRVQSVDPDGTATLEISTRQLGGTLNGVRLPAGKAYTTIWKVTPNGRVVGQGGVGVMGSASASGAGGEPYLPLLPGHKVRPGETWKDSIDIPVRAGSGTAHVESASRYLRSEGERAVIQTTSQATMDVKVDLSQLLQRDPGETATVVGGRMVDYKGSVSTDQTAWLDTKTGRVSRTTITQTLDVDMTVEAPGSPSPSPTRSTGTQNIDLTLAPIEGP